MHTKLMSLSRHEEYIGSHALTFVHIPVDMARDWVGVVDDCGAQHIRLQLHKRQPSLCIVKVPGDRLPRFVRALRHSNAVA